MNDDPGVAVRLDGVHKTYVVRTKAGRVRRRRADVHAVDDVSFEIRAGEMVGYLGPNGAGKSTTIKMITGILTPSGGDIEVLGLRPVADRRQLARQIGVVFGQRSQLWWDLPLIESFELLHHVYATERSRYRENLDGFVERLDLAAFIDTPVRQLSLGQRMRGELTAALLHDPALVVLDEPTIGLDVVSKHAVRGFLSEINRERGTTVLLTTHDLDDVEQLCERMLIIDRGRVLLDGGVAEFKATHGTHRMLVVDFVDALDPVHVDGAEVIRTDGPRQWIRFDRRTISASALIGAVADGRAVHDLTIEEPEIEELIRAIYENRPTA